MNVNNYFKLSASKMVAKLTAKKYKTNPALLGNTYAKGCETNGRPVKYTKEYLDKEAIELIKWSQSDNATSLYKFTYDKDYCASDLSEFCDRSQDFRKALVKAKERIANNREESCNKQLLDKTIWARTVRMYDNLLTKEEDNTKDEEIVRKMRLMDYEAKLKSENGGGTEADKQKLESALSLINYLQSQISNKSPKIDDSTNNND
jgi:hypothetical protein